MEIPAKEENEAHRVTQCWQYEVRQSNYDADIARSSLTINEIESLSPKDFKIMFIDKENSKLCQQAKDFIVRHEWLGKMPNRPTHRFGAFYKGELAGVLVMATPNAFSNLLGKENKHIEKLISRGACISWSPKGLGSYLIQQSINWMVENTEFRFFTAYSDPEANELGTIYQALNMIYLGQRFGAKKMYLDPTNKARGWFSSRAYRTVTSYRRYAKELGIDWEQSWSTKDKVHWNLIPENIEKKLRRKSKLYQESCIERDVLPKHKYLKLQGKDKRETKRLKKLFLKHNPKLNHIRKDGLLTGIEYPKNRGE